MKGLGGFCYIYFNASKKQYYKTCKMQDMEMHVKHVYLKNINSEGANSSVVKSNKKNTVNNCKYTSDSSLF